MRRSGRKDKRLLVAISVLVAVAGTATPAIGAGTFLDDDGNLHEANIEAIAAASITEGCSPLRFCPNRGVTRGEMAAFLTRALDLPLASTDYFTDDETSIFEPAINAIALAGITVGCSTTTYCPNRTVTRGEMASFLARGLGLDPIQPVSSCERFVDIGGSDDEAGTSTNPWRTLAHAAEASPDIGCTVWVRPGTYRGLQEIERRFTRMTTFRSVEPYRAILEGTGTVLKVNGARNVGFEGFEIRHTGPGAVGVVVYVDQGNDLWAEAVVFRDNIIHDSYDNDLLKLNNGVRNAIVEGNVFYNQGPGEEHMDVNGVTDIVIRGNVFFNSFARSGRTPSDSKHYVVVKDSTATVPGSRRIEITGNVFLNWEGGRETLVQIGADGKAYYEAADVAIENNLMIGNSTSVSTAALGLAGVRDVTFTNNTVVGDLPSGAFAVRIDRKGANPANMRLAFRNNIWADPTGTMDDLTDGSRSAEYTIDSNLYWNAGAQIPMGNAFSVADDVNAQLGNPALGSNHSNVLVPYWTGSGFVSGNTLIRHEFDRLVARYGSIGTSSAAIDAAAPAYAPAVDILGRTRDSSPDIGAFEGSP